MMLLFLKLPSWQLVLQSCLVLLLGGVSTFVVKLYRVRRRFQQMQKEGLVSRQSKALMSVSLTSISAHAAPSCDLWAFATGGRDHVKSAK